MTDTLLVYQTPEHEAFLWEGNTDCAALLVHGFPGTPAEMRPIAELLFGQGWTTQGILLPGFGREIADMAHYTQEDWATAVGAAAAALRRKHRVVVLAGNSVGAALCLQSAARQSIDGMLLFAPFWRADNRLLDMVFPIAKHFFRHIRPFKDADFEDAGLQESIMRFMPDADLGDPEVQETIRQLSLPTDVLGQVRSAGRRGYAAAACVTAPTLILQGRQDVVSAPALTEQIAARLPNLIALRMVDGEHDLTQRANGAAAELDDAVYAFTARFHGDAMEAPAPTQEVCP